MQENVRCTLSTLTAVWGAADLFLTGKRCICLLLTLFGTVTAARENEDGTVTLTVDAVCDMVICDDEVITSALTVKCNENGSFRYMGNKVIKDNISIASKEKDYEKSISYQ